MRVGLGYDIHRTAPGQSIVLGGIEIPSRVRLVGHSDADVAIHAVIDALLGAAALGDVGRYFPNHDERYRGISSLVLLGEVSRVLAEAGYRAGNVDLVIVAEEPMISPHATEMSRVIADALGIEPGATSVKATTNEGVGPEGRGEAISARAVALVTRVE